MNQNLTIPQNVKDLMQKLLDAGKEAYVVGGAVRDSILGVEPHDYDLFTNATGEEILDIFPHGKVLGGDERQSKILTVIVDGIEVSQYRSNGDRTEVGGDLKTHCSTCDFTINAMVMDINGNIEDFHNGREDLEHNVLKFVGKGVDRINEDLLRLLRAIRFICKYNLEPHFYDTEPALIENNNISDLPPERVKEELLKILKYEDSVEELDEYGFLEQMIPELYHKNNFLSGGDHHNETPFEHMCNAFKESCKITDNVLLRFACLMHDVGKGECRTTKIKDAKLQEVSLTPNGIEPSFLVKEEKIHFYEHENVGADMVEVIMNRLKFSVNDIKYVKRLVKCHMYSFKAKPGKKSYVRFFKKLEDNNISITDYMVMIYCDRQGNMKKSRIKFGDFINNSWIHKKYYEIKYSEEPMRVSELKVSGQDVMDILGLAPSRKVGEILKEIFDRVMDGKIENNRSTLLTLLESYEDIK